MSVQEQSFKADKPPVSRPARTRDSESRSAACSPLWKTGKNTHWRFDCLVASDSRHFKDSAVGLTRPLSPFWPPWRSSDSQLSPLVSLGNTWTLYHCHRACVCPARYLKQMNSRTNCLKETRREQPFIWLYLVSWRRCRLEEESNPAAVKPLPDRLWKTSTHEGLWRTFLQT